jgi:hypothetical protein
MCIIFAMTEKSSGTHPHPKEKQQQKPSAIKNTMNITIRKFLY